MPEDSGCANCRHWSVLRGVRDAERPLVGECRRYPPTTETSDEEYWSHWPVVTSEAWCGEFSRLSH